MATALAQRAPDELNERIRAAAVQLAQFLGVLAALWGLWEAFKWIGETTELKLGNFQVNDGALPHVPDIVAPLFEPPRRNGPLLVDVLFDAALFTAKEAALGFALGATFGFAIAVVLAHSRLLQRGFLPYIVASQTVPILAIAPMVVVWVNPKMPEGLKDWGAVAVIAAYLTFFPVAINTLRGLHSCDPRALELMRSYASSTWSILWKLRVPASLPYLFAALKVSATASVVGAIIGELPASVQDGLGGAILNFNQYYASAPTRLWATNLVAAALGIAFFLLVVAAERAVVRRAPQDVDLEIAPGEFVSLIGPSGCGKSTLLRIVGDLIQPSTGTVVVNGKSAHQARVDRDYGIVFQDAVLYDWRTVSKNIALPLEMAGWDRARRSRRVEAMLELVELAGFGDHHPWQLSGGMQQRVSIARALSFSPPLLLMDEPFGALDEMTRERMNSELLRIWEEAGATVVFVTHSIAEAVFLSTRVVVMSRRPGRIASIVEVDLPQPRDSRTRADPRFAEHIRDVRRLLREGGGFDVEEPAGEEDLIVAEEGLA